KTYPDVACGLKRGFTYYHHSKGKRFEDTPDRNNQLLVAASPNDYVSDMHWFRADVDHFLQREAVSAGAAYLEHVHLRTITNSGAKGISLTGERFGKSIDIRAG